MRLSEQFATLPWGEAVLAPIPPPKKLVDELRKQLGHPAPAWLPHLHSLPWLMDTLFDMTDIKTCHLAADLSAMVGLVVTQDNSCRYCYGVSRAMLQLLGHTEREVLAVERDLESARLSAHDRALLGWARRFSRANPRPSPADRAALLQAGCTAGEVAETGFVAAAHGFANRVVTILAIPAESGLETQLDGVFMRMFRPLIGRKIRRGMRGTPVEPMRADDALASRCVAALGDSPGAHVVRRAVDRMQASDVLPARTKLLVAAVIGRALGCRGSEAETLRQLPQFGLEPTDLEEILANLASRKLDARESKLIPFARETVRYQPYQLQTRMHELSKGLTREEVLEFVGVAALANAVARLSVLLDAC